MEYLRQLGWFTTLGPLIAPDAPNAERSSYEIAHLYGRLSNAVARINPDLAQPVIDEAMKRLERAEFQSALAENLRVHELITQGVPVEQRDETGAVRTVTSS